jgi:hypothetical protein
MYNIVHINIIQNNNFLLKNNNYLLESYIFNMKCINFNTKFTILNFLTCANLQIIEK